MHREGPVLLGADASRNRQGLRAEAPVSLEGAWFGSATVLLLRAVPTESANRKKELKRVLRDAGLRATSARTLVLDCLMRAGRALTHAEVCEELDEHGYDRATLYRNLVDLTSGGLVNRTDLGDHLWRFELVGGGGHDSSAHAHFVCQECGDVSCLPDDAVSVKSRRGVPKAIKQKQVEIQVRGVCNECA